MHGSYWPSPVIDSQTQRALVSGSTYRPNSYEMHEGRLTVMIPEASLNRPLAPTSSDIRW